MPVVVLTDMTEADRRAYVMADNRIAELAGWDRDILAIEYQGLHDLQFDDIEVTGFSLGEIDTILDEASEKKPANPARKMKFLPFTAAPVSRKGDLWILGLAPPAVRGCARSDATMPGCSKARSPIWF